MCPRTSSERSRSRVLTVGCALCNHPVWVIQMAARNDLPRFRYAAASINIFGLLLSVATWAFRAWHLPLHPDLTDFGWTLGAVCWLFGLIVLIITWIVDG
jgi:hypothetical protein